MKKTFKRSLSVILTLMMVLSCFSVIGPIEAKALPATDSTYTNSGIYSTPPFTGKGDRWFRWATGSDYVTVYYPSHIYLDKTETLQSAGYHFDVEWHFGNSAQFRILLGAPIWGDNSAYSGLPYRYYTMTDIFSDYKVDAALPKGAPAGWYGDGTGSSTDYDLRIIGYGHANQGTDGFTANNARHEKYVLFRTNTSYYNPSSSTIYLMGTPSSSYVGTTTEYNTTQASIGSYGLAQQYGNNNTWSTHSSSSMFNTKGSTSSYMEGQWIEMQWFVTVYDKSELNNEVVKAGQILGQQQSYGDNYVVQGRYSDLKQHYNEAVALVSTREVTQNDLDTKEGLLYNAANTLYYGADTTELKSLVAQAEAIIAEADYAVKYSAATRNNLETVLSNVKAYTFYPTAPKYHAYTNSDAGRLAAADQTSVDSAENELRTAINGITKATYTIKLNKANGKTNSYNWAYGFNIPDSYFVNSEVAADAANHYTVSWDKEISRTVTGNAEYTEVVTGIAHDWNDWYTTVYPSCTDEGQMYRTCKICNYRQDDKIGTTAHTPLPERITDEVEATCKTPGSYVSTVYCEVCGNQISQQTVTVPKKSHTPGEKVKENEVKATCTENGHYEEVVYCTVCNDELSRKEITVGSAHTNSAPYVVTEKSTCSKQGFTKTTIFCTECSQILDEKIDYLPFAEHTPGEAKKENEVDAGCEQPGSYDMVTRCAECLTVLSSEHFETEAGSHDWNEWQTVSEPDCENDGLQTRVCKNDSSHVEEKVIPTEGHKYTSTVYPPTCTADGYTKYICSVCSDTYTDNIVGTNGHTPKEAVIEKEVKATCKVAAYHEEVVYCAVCNTELSRTPVNGTTIPHTEEKIPAVEATCTSTGLTAGVKCSVCGDILVAQETVPVIAHNMGEFTETVAATCKAAGEERADCTECDYFETRATAKLAHTEEIVPGIAATCTSTGLTEGIRCSVCDEVIKAGTVIPKEVHELGEWITETEPTCTKEGKKVAMCINCEYTEERAIPATGHNYNDDGICEDCGTEEKCGHLCHRAERNFFAKIVWGIIRYICSIFGLGRTCACGDAHY